MPRSHPDTIRAAAESKNVIPAQQWRKGMAGCRDHTTSVATCLMCAFAAENQLHRARRERG